MSVGAWSEQSSFTTTDLRCPLKDNIYGISFDVHHLRRVSNGEETVLVSVPNLELGRGPAWGPAANKEVVHVADVPEGVWGYFQVDEGESMINVCEELYPDECPYADGTWGGLSQGVYQVEFKLSRYTNELKVNWYRSTPDATSYIGENVYQCAKFEQLW